MVKKIKVASIDYDGCLSHQGYQQALEDNPDKPKPAVLIESNLVMMGYLRSKGIDALMIGSNRQDIETDFMNSKKANFAKGNDDELGSGFTMLEEISTEIGARFSPFVLADLYADKEEGYSYKRALELQEGHPHEYPNLKKKDYDGEPKWVFDEQKVSIVYAQIQKLSLENPDDEIEFNFIDDREDILNAVENFFEKHPEMIPGNVTLKTQRYYNANPDRQSALADMQVEERRSISSPSKTTKANPLYKETLKSWAQNNSDESHTLIKADEDNPKEFHQSYGNLVSEHQKSLKQSQSFLAQASANINLALEEARTFGKNLWEGAKQLGSTAPRAISTFGKGLWESIKQVGSTVSQNLSSFFGEARARGNTLVESVRELGSTVVRSLTNAKQKEKEQEISATFDELRKYANQYNGAKARLNLQRGYAKDNYTVADMHDDMKQMQDAIEKIKALKIPEGMEGEAQKYESAKDMGKLKWANYQLCSEIRNGNEVQVANQIFEDINNRCIPVARAKEASVAMGWKKNGFQERHDLHANSEKTDPAKLKDLKKSMSDFHNPAGREDNTVKDDEARQVLPGGPH